MKRFPTHGFAKRVDDTVARAMAILRAKEVPMTEAGIPVARPREPTNGHNPRSRDFPEEDRRSR